MSPEAVPDSIRNALGEERDALIRQLDELGFGGGQSRGLDYDSNFADTSQVTTERSEAGRVAASLQDSLDEVEHALAKISAGTFGACEKCAQPIPTARLEAMPMSRLCMECASATR